MWLNNAIQFWICLLGRYMERFGEDELEVKCHTACSLVHYYRVWGTLSDILTSVLVRQYDHTHKRNEHVAKVMM